MSISNLKLSPFFCSVANAMSLSKRRHCSDGEAGIMTSVIRFHKSQRRHSFNGEAGTATQ